MSVNNVNYTRPLGRMFIRVMCPKCGVGGGQMPDCPKPKCHICADGTKMQPASNYKIECIWKRAVKRANELEILWSKRK